MEQKNKMGKDKIEDEAEKKEGFVAVAKQFEMPDQKTQFGFRERETG